jgi:hypothetical protein
MNRKNREHFANPNVDDNVIMEKSPEVLVHD